MSSHKLILFVGCHPTNLSCLWDVIPQTYLAYGIVWKAIDRRTGEIVAVKKIFDAFRNRTDAQRTFREIMFLQEFGEHPNIIKLLNVIRAQNDKDIYLVFESMETDLHAVIKKGNLLKDIHKCYILYQLLKATKFIHSGNVIHRDQKPSNILLDADCFVKLCDFGLARSLSQLHEDQGNPALTEYVATRWYRAPEILLSSHSSVHHIHSIFSFTDIVAIQTDYRASIVNRMSSRRRVTFEELLPASAPPEALDLLKKLLVFNPEKRLTAEEALEHPYVKRFHCSTKEPSLDYDVILPLDDDIQLSVAEYRNKLYEVQMPSPHPITHLPRQPPGRTARSYNFFERRGALGQPNPHRKGVPQPRCGHREHPLLRHPWTTAGADPPPGGSGQNTLNRARKTNNSQCRERSTGVICSYRETHPILKSSKKMFQVTANLGAAGDPKASLGSYSQSYGTICKSALQNLPISNPCQQAPTLSPQQ
uniref:mitogen-activated protein kinase n=1 Tax=Sphenodon punctatus TaxID=8508 RepID=A0A8D0H3P4_SPHPU